MLLTLSSATEMQSRMPTWRSSPRRRYNQLSQTMGEYAYRGLGFATTCSQCKSYFTGFQETSQSASESATQPVTQSASQRSALLHLQGYCHWVIDSACKKRKKQQATLFTALPLNMETCPLFICRHSEISNGTREK